MSTMRVIGGLIAVMVSAAATVITPQTASGSTGTVVAGSTVCNGTAVTRCVWLEILGDGEIRAVGRIRDNQTDSVNYDVKVYGLSLWVAGPDRQWYYTSESSDADGWAATSDLGYSHEHPRYAGWCYYAQAGFQWKQPGATTPAPDFEDSNTVCD